MEQNKQGTARIKWQAALFFIVIVVVVVLIVAAVILTRPASPAEETPKPLKQGTIDYAPVTDVETARQLVVHPGAELHGFRYKVGDDILGVRIYVEQYMDGVYLGNAGMAGGGSFTPDGAINVSFGMRDDKKGVDWCLGSGGGSYRFTQAFPEGFVPQGWNSSALNADVEAKPQAWSVQADEPLVLAAIAVTDSGGIQGFSVRELMENSALLREYRCVQLLKCEFYTRDILPKEEMLIGLVEGGELKYEADITLLPERVYFEDAIEQYLLTSAAWPGRDPGTVQEAVRLRRRLPDQGEAPEALYEEYYAFRLEDGTPVLLSQAANQMSVISGDTLDALLEAARRVTPS